MKKRIISLVLVLCMVAAVLPIPASAYTGDIPGVDYARIEYNTIMDQEVKIKIGSHEFTGKLSNGNRLDDEEVDGIIREFMYGSRFPQWESPLQRTSVTAVWSAPPSPGTTPCMMN